MRSERQPRGSARHPAGGPRHAAPEASLQPHDAVLVQRVAARDETALAALYDRYAAMVNGLALSILRDTALSEETTHDVFLRVWEQPTAYDHARGSFAGWLSRVTRNRAIDLLRRRREAPIGGMESDPTSWIPDPDPGPEDQAVGTLDRQEVRRALTELSDDQRTLLELAYYHGLSQREIAERLGRPIGTVKSQIRSAMHQLADRLATDNRSSTERA